MAELLDFNVVPYWEAVIRILASAALAMIIGLERDMKNKPIDFRAYMIVATVSCAIAIMAQEIHVDYLGPDETVGLDFMRVIEGVLTGIGFLGAGAIIRSRDSDRVIGTATGASIWASGGLGLSLGFGFYGLTAMAFLVIAGTLFTLGFLRGEAPLGNGGKEKD